MLFALTKSFVGADIALYRANDLGASIALDE